MNKIAVIGAGIVGVCIAHFLKKSGHDVTLRNDGRSFSSRKTWL